MKLRPDPIDWLDLPVSDLYRYSVPQYCWRRLPEALDRHHKGNLPPHVRAQVGDVLMRLRRVRLGDGWVADYFFENGRLMWVKIVKASSEIAPGAVRRPYLDLGIAYEHKPKEAAGTMRLKDFFRQRFFPKKNVTRSRIEKFVAEDANFFLFDAAGNAVDKKPISNTAPTRVEWVKQPGGPGNLWIPAGSTALSQGTVSPVLSAEQDA